MSDSVTKNIFRADMHNHTSNSPDSDCPIDDLCIAQIEKGINTFAITDHLDLEFKDNVEDQYARILRSCEQVRVCNEKYRDKIEILGGVEISCAHTTLQSQDKMLSLHPFDVVIGSVHTVFIPGYGYPYSRLDFSKLSDETLKLFMDTYFSDLYTTAKITDYDILAHLTCPLRYINGKYKLGFDITMYEEQIREILKVVISRSKALELNTSNCTEDMTFFMPDPEILSIYYDLGGRIVTIGSDAHVACNAAKAFDRAEELLRTIGFDRLCIFRKRTPIFYSI